MQSLDLKVLRDALSWYETGQTVTLYTVVQTWGSAPRPAGALLAVRGDGLLSGSVSGGCVEDDLIVRARQSTELASPALPQLLSYGVTQDEAARFGLPCGGSLRLVQEPVWDAQWMRQLLERTAEQQLVVRELQLPTGQVQLLPAEPGQALQFDGQRLRTVWGPQWRLLLIGAGQLSQAVAQMAQLIDFEVLVCDPREEYGAAPGADSLMRRLEGMPDDVVRALQPDAHMAIVALTHDPKLDDMALLEALQSNAFYVGALGSRRNQAARRQRLMQHFGLSEQQLDRLRGPVGLALGGKTPAEIAVAIVAELVQFKNRQSIETAVSNRAGS